MSTIVTLDKVKEWAQQYRDSERSNDGCTYSNDGETPNCIIGQFIFDEVQPLWHWMMANSEQAVAGTATCINKCPVDTLFKVFPSPFVVFTQPAKVALRQMQNDADNGKNKWGNVVDLAFPKGR